MGFFDKLFGSKPKREDLFNLVDPVQRESVNATVEYLINFGAWRRIRLFYSKRNPPILIVEHHKKLVLYYSAFHISKYHPIEGYLASYTTEYMNEHWGEENKIDISEDYKKEFFMEMRYILGSATEKECNQWFRSFIKSLIDGRADNEWPDHGIEASESPFAKKITKNLNEVLKNHNWSKVKLLYNEKQKPAKKGLEYKREFIYCFGIQLRIHGYATEQEIEKLLAYEHNEYGDESPYNFISGASKDECDTWFSRFIKAIPQSEYTSLPNPSSILTQQEDSDSDSPLESSEDSKGSYYPSPKDFEDSIRFNARSWLERKDWEKIANDYNNCYYNDPLEYKRIFLSELLTQIPLLILTNKEEKKFLSGIYNQIMDADVKKCDFLLKELQMKFPLENSYRPLLAGDKHLLSDEILKAFEQDELAGLLTLYNDPRDYDPFEYKRAFLFDFCTAILLTTHSGLLPQREDRLFVTKVQGQLSKVDSDQCDLWFRTIFDELLSVELKRSKDQPQKSPSKIRKKAKVTFKQKSSSQISDEELPEIFLKNITQQRAKNTMLKTQGNPTMPEEEDIITWDRKDTELVNKVGRLNRDKILWVRSNDHYLSIEVTDGDGDLSTIRFPLKDFFGKYLDNSTFQKVHKSYVANFALATHAKNFNGRPHLYFGTKKIPLNPKWWKLIKIYREQLGLR